MKHARLLNILSLIILERHVAILVTLKEKKNWANELHN